MDRTERIDERKAYPMEVVEDVHVVQIWVREIFFGSCIIQSGEGLPHHNPFVIEMVAR